jgi:hypothetical protein
MFQEIRSAIDALAAVVRDLEPGVLDGPGATRLLELFVRGEHVCAAGKALAATRVDATGAHRVRGHRSAGELLAAVSGVTVGAAESTLRTAKRLEDLPATDAAFRAGELSELQAREVSYAASKDPAAEGALLGTAKRGRVKGLKEHCARVVAASIADDEAWARELHGRRAVYTWTEHGAFRADVTLAPDRAAGFHAALEAETELLFREARSQGRREARAAYMADALANLVAHGPSKPIDARLNADATALERGHIIAGETCEIDGLGPIPVTTARQLLRDARVTLLVRDETDHISHVSSVTRPCPRSCAAGSRPPTPPAAARVATTPATSSSTTSRTTPTAASSTSTTPGASAPPATTSRPTAAGRSSAHPGAGTSSHPITPTTRIPRDLA